MTKQKPEKAFWMFCRECGCQYLEPISWVTGTSGTTQCPRCGHKLRID